VREVAHIGATIGREFSFELLRALYPESEDRLHRALQELVESEFVFRRGSAPRTIYRFKHALVQEAIYGSLLRDQRKQLHRKIAAALERQFSEIVGAYPEVIAHHWAQAGSPREAISYWMKGGQTTLGRSSIKEALANFHHALNSLIDLSDSKERVRLEIDVRIALAAAYIVQYGYTSSDAAVHLERAGELCVTCGMNDKLLPILHSQYVAAISRDIPESLSIAQRMVDIADQPVSRLMSHRALGQSLFFCGRFSESRDQLLFARDQLSSMPSNAEGFTYDPRISVLTSLANLAYTTLALGYPDAARRYSRESIEGLNSEATPLTHVAVLHHACVLQWMLDDAAHLETIAKRMSDIATEENFALFRDAGLLFSAIAACHLRLSDETIGQLDAGMEALKRSGTYLHIPMALMERARACNQMGIHAEVDALIKESFSTMEITGETWCEAEMMRMDAEIHWSHHRDQGHAEERYQEALKKAHKQGARWWILRTGTSLARLWSGQQKYTSAQELLAPIMAEFTEGFDVPAIKNGGALLREVGEAASVARTD
jgi:hypothetical protein